MVSRLLFLTLLGLLAAVQGGVVPYTLELRTWVVDYQRPTAGTRLAPFYLTAGTQLEAILANNSYPGPALELKVGDTLLLTVVNNLLMNAVDLKFEGLALQKGPAAPINPQGAVFTYSLTATTPGIFAWHADTPRQAASGLRGAIVVRNSSVVADTDKLIVLSDARATPKLCFDGTTGAWDMKMCPGTVKASFNGIWGDNSKNYPRADLEVVVGQCYQLQILGLATQPQNMFDLSVASHTMTLSNGQNASTVTIAADKEATVVGLCADQKAGSYAITYSYYNAASPSDKKDFTATLKYM